MSEGNALCNDQVKERDMIKWRKGENKRIFPEITSILTEGEISEDTKN
jgi:hypothetical protein